MSVIVTDGGFGSDAFAGCFATLDSQAANATGLDLASDADPLALDDLDRWALIRIDFPSFADGRGFSIARALRQRGYGGTLRARGHVIADQYAMARRSGFDEVEISDDLAARQPEGDWLARANWTAHDYQSRMRG
ncbi:MAG: DUF934 domain-containing protein [Planctomycetota bacterium]